MLVVVLASGAGLGLSPKAFGASGRVAQAQKDKMFVIPTTGLEFTVPTGWKAKTNKRETQFTFALPTSGQAAVLHVFAIEFRVETERWFDAQKDIATELHQTLLNQHQEELLGVPLLLSKVRSDKGVVLTGLLYTQAKNKMLFRLESSQDGADEAEQLLRNVLLGLKTVSGLAPTPDDPNKNLPAKTIATAGAPPKVTPIGQVAAPKYFKGPVSLVTKAALRTVTVTFPRGWSYETDKAGNFLLKSPGGPDAVKTNLNLTVLSSLDSDPALTSLLKLSSASLDYFAKVALRDEKDSVKNLAGSQVSRVWRTGTGSFTGGTAGPIETLEAVVVNGDFYIIIQAKFSPSLTSGQQGAIESMLQHVGVEGGA